MVAKKAKKKVAKNRAKSQLFSLAINTLQKFYPAYIHRPSNGSYGVSFPDVPGCVSAGATFEDAIGLAAEALAVHLELRAEDKQPIPAPSTYDMAVKLSATDPEIARDLVSVQLVPASVDEPAVRLSVSMPADLVRRIDAVAGSYGRSGFLADAARDRLAQFHRPLLYDLKDNKLSPRRGSFVSPGPVRSGGHLVRRIPPKT